MQSQETFNPLGCTCKLIIGPGLVNQFPADRCDFCKAFDRVFLENSFEPMRELRASREAKDSDQL